MSADAAVLVIDVQQGLCVGDDAAWDCAGTIRRINVVTAKARAARVPVVFIQHEAEGGLLAHGSATWQLADGLNVHEGDLRMRKTTCDSYLRTSLEATLRERGVTRVIVCGMHTEFCVDSTARGALARGFAVTLVSDAHTSAGNAALTPAQVIAHHNATLPNIESFGPRVTLQTADRVSF